jgi:hypothetical protein
MVLYSLAQDPLLPESPLPRMAATDLPLLSFKIFLYHTRDQEEA